jgi:N-acetyl-anhydromuramyl-L-alanine amidase AmpD
MEIIDYPSPNYFDNVSSKIQAIVLHGTAGSLSSALAELTNPKAYNPDARVSSNYVIGRNGSIYRLVAYWQGKRAWANGILNRPDSTIDWLMECAARGLNPNKFTISIEHEAASGDMLAHNYSSMPKAQLASSKELVRTLLGYNGLIADHNSIIGHNQIDSVSRAFCPGVINIPEYIANL